MQGDSGPGTPSSRGGRQPIRQEDEDGVGHSLLQTIKDRIALYREAEQVAAAQGEGGKARRAARGLRTLQVFIYSILFLINVSNLIFHLKERCPSCTT